MQNGRRKRRRRKLRKYKEKRKEKKDRTKYLYNFLIEKDKIKNIMNVVFVVCSILKVKKNCTNSIILV